MSAGSARSGFEAIVDMPWLLPVLGLVCIAAALLLIRSIDRLELGPNVSKAVATALAIEAYETFPGAPSVSSGSPQETIASIFIPAVLLVLLVIFVVGVYRNRVDEWRTIRESGLAIMFVPILATAARWFLFA
jgi:hypothetical protein